VIADCAHYVDGQRGWDEPLDLDAAAEIYRRDEPGFVWIALVEPDLAEMARVQNLFGLHDLAVEDAQAPHLRPKVEQYESGRVLFGVIRTARYVDDTEEVDFGEVAIFISHGFLITVRHGVADLASARQKVESRPELLKAGPVAALWAILDKIVDDYTPVVAGLENDVEQVESTVFRGTTAATERIYKLRQEATDFYRAVHPLLSPLDAVEQGAYPQVPAQLMPFFRDVNDHLKMIDEDVIGLRDTLTSVLQANIAVIALEQNNISVAQNETAKLLTVIATIFLPLSFVTGFFGMNFEWMTSHITAWWQFVLFGFGSLAVSCAVLLVWFRRSGMMKPL